MKTFKLLQFLFLATVLFSCSATDPAPASNAFTIGATTFYTPHAYLFYGNSPSYRDGFMIALTNAPVVQDNTNGAAPAITMTQGAVLFVRNSTNYFPTEQQVIISNATYTLDKNNAAIFTNVTAFTNTFVNNGLTYGQPDSASANNHSIENTGNGTITINSITIDYLARTGTIDCNYELIDDDGITVTGNYAGTFEIRNGS